MRFRKSSASHAHYKQSKIFNIWCQSFPINSAGSLLSSGRFYSFPIIYNSLIFIFCSNFLILMTYLIFFLCLLFPIYASFSFILIHYFFLVYWVPEVSCHLHLKYSANKSFSFLFRFHLSFFYVCIFCVLP